MINYISQLKTRNLNSLTKEILNYYSKDNTSDRTMILSSIVKNIVKIDINEGNFKLFYRYIPKTEYIEYADRKNANWRCNIQQIKINNIGNVIFALYFSDMVCFYRLKKREIQLLDSFCSKQHKDNNNECQFNVSKKNIDLFDKYKILSIKYSECFIDDSK